MRNRKEYMRKYWHDYYLKNKNEILAKQKEYQIENKEKISERHKKYNQKIQSSNKVLTELEEWLKNEKDYYFENYYYSDFNAYGSKLDDVLDKIQELKEKYK